jgi:hypothetical protein
MHLGEHFVRIDCPSSFTAYLSSSKGIAKAASVNIQRRTNCMARRLRDQAFAHTAIGGT